VARQKSSASWTRRVERDSLRHPARAMKEAIRTWRSLKDDPIRFELVDEVAQDRGPELTLAYRNVIMLAAGFRHRTGKTGRPARTREPCVVFVVKAKWAHGDAPDDDAQRIPPYLLAHVTLDGARVRCAVPTDVQCQDRFQDVRPRASATLAIGSGGLSATGAAAFAVQVGDGAQAVKLLLSAHHVFSSFPNVQTGIPRSGLQISRLGPTGGVAQAFAVSASWGGKMRADGEPSFDVQMARVSNWSAARAVLADLRLSSTQPYAGSPGQVIALGEASRFHILVPPDNPEWQGSSRGPTRVKFDMVLSDSYGFNFDVSEEGGIASRHLTFHRLVRMERIAGGGALLGGDSGSAVVAVRSDGTHTLIGLFIAAGDEFAYCIPAWQLFDRRYYARLPGDGRIFPVPA
jgi:hypothetical protein